MEYNLSYVLDKKYRFGLIPVKGVRTLVYNRKGNKSQNRYLFDFDKFKYVQQFHIVISQLNKEIITAIMDYMAFGFLYIILTIAYNYSSLLTPSQKNL